MRGHRPLGDYINSISFSSLAIRWINCPLQIYLVDPAYSSGPRPSDIMDIIIFASMKMDNQNIKTSQNPPGSS